MITIILGGLGQGKTLLGLYLTLMLVKKGYYPYSTASLYGIHYKKVTSFNDCWKIPQNQKTVLFFDEIYLLFDALNKSSNEQMRMRNFFMSARKMQHHIIGTSQTLGQLYIRGRLILDYIIIPQYNEQTKTLTYITKTPDSETGQFIPLYRKPQKIYNCQKLFKYYDTKEILSGFLKEEISIDSELTLMDFMENG